MTNKIGLSHGSNIKEIVEDLKKDMGVPEEDVLILVHIQRKDVERVCSSLELSGVVKQIGALRPTDRN